ncbi:hypothetical protein AUL38_10770 [Leucobacter sp. G161]|nr:hypothetical protein AUL38_10770 [Leucobacter sp. G161]
MGSDSAAKYATGVSSYGPITGLAETFKSLQVMLPMARIWMPYTWVPAGECSAFTISKWMRPCERVAAVIVNWIITPIAAIAPNIAPAITQAFIPKL